MDEKEEETEENLKDVEDVQESESEAENKEESLEELALGREEKEEDELVLAISNAAKPPEKVKPPDLISTSMVTDISFHPQEEIIAICNIEGEISW